MCAALLVQFFHGYHRYQFGLYIANLFGMDLLRLRFPGHPGVFHSCHLAQQICRLLRIHRFPHPDHFIWSPLHIATYLVQFGQAQTMTYSDFFGYAPFIESWAWFMLYWTAFCVFLAAATILLWQRGRETSWRSRIRNARLRFHGAVRFVAVAAAIVLCRHWGLDFLQHQGPEHGAKRKRCRPPAGRLREDLQEVREAARAADHRREVCDRSLSRDRAT